MLISKGTLDFFDCLPHGYCLIDRQFTILAWNRSLEEWSGRLRSEMIGSQLDSIQPKFQDPQYKMRFDMVFESGTPFVFSPMLHSQVIPCGTKDAQQVHRTYLIKYNKEDTDLALLVVENVTRSHSSTIRYRQLTEELEVSKQEALTIARNLSIANEELNQFAYRTSHDLRAPVSTSKRLVNVILDDFDDKDMNEAKLNIRKIGHIMENLEILIDDILSLVKADHTENEADFANVKDLVEAVLERLRPLAYECGCELYNDIDSSVQVTLPKTRVVQVLENIISNGIKYNDPSKEKSYVKIAMQENSDGLYFSVVDNGIGIPEGFKDQVYKMFTRLTPDVSFGSGLGMSIVKKHIDFMGGSIDFSSSDDGTSFSIFIPKYEVHLKHA